MTDPRPGPSPTRPAAGPAAPGAPTPGAFVQTILRSRLLDRPHLDAVLAAAPESARASARTLADHFIEVGELTHYQTEKMLQGRWQGLVLGPYHVLAPLGRGGMGTVYLAKRAAEGVSGGRGEGVMVTDHPVVESPLPPLTPSPLPFQLVALKVLPPKRAREEEKTLLRFRREMDLGRHLAHPNVTRTLDAGVLGGVHYIAMEFVPGESVRQMVGKGGPLPVADAARLFADVAAGLAHAHDKGLIHRDLKPSNIMVTPGGQAKILDLGLALLVGEVLPEDPSIVGGEGYILGTMDYIAPEQTSDATNVGPGSDVYSLGCALYYAVTGVPPFPGGTALQKMRWHRTSTAPPANLINPVVPAGFAQVIERLMAKRPEDRLASAEAVRELLLPWAGETVARAAGVPAPHSDQEAVTGVDTRTLDPALWDDIPVADLGTPEAEPNEPPPRRQVADDVDAEIGGGGQSALIGFVVGAVVIGLVLLILLFGLLRRL